MLSLCLWGLCFCGKVVFFGGILFSHLCRNSMPVYLLRPELFWKGHEKCILPKWLLNRMKVSCKIRLKFDLFWFFFFSHTFSLTRTIQLLELWRSGFRACTLKVGLCRHLAAILRTSTVLCTKTFLRFGPSDPGKVGQKYLGKVCVNFRWGNFLFFQGAGGRFSFPKSATLQA